MKTEGKNGPRLIDAALDYLFEKYKAWLRRCLRNSINALSGLLVPACPMFSDSASSLQFRCWGW